MDQAGYDASLRFNLKKESPFSFKCQVCSACCTNKAIGIAPYEALRLSRNLGLTTTAFYRTFTEDGGTILRIKPDGSCIFLGPRGCGVHPDRPLVCRLFPLGQIVDKRGRELYAIMPLHPDCLGLVGTDGTVESYLESQGVGDCFRWDRAYSSVYKKMMRNFSRQNKSQEELKSQSRRKDIHGRLGRRTLNVPPSSGYLLSAWLDIDGTVTSYCQEKKREKPENVDELAALHLQAIQEWLEQSRIGFPDKRLAGKGADPPFVGIFKILPR